MPLLENGIVMWSGALNEIPNNFVLCDGTNGTPDLRDKFIIGAGTSYSLNDIGGSLNVVLAEHGHSLTGSLSNSAALSHTHNFFSVTGTAGNARRWTRGSSNNKTTAAGGAHGHAVLASNAGPGEDGIGKNLPPYYALAFIKQIG